MTINQSINDVTDAGIKCLYYLDLLNVTSNYLELIFIYKL